MKKIVAAMMCAVMLVSMTACGNSQTATTQKKETTKTEASNENTGEAQATEETAHEPVTIRFYNYELSEQAKADWWEKTIADFEAKNDWVTVETVTVDYNSMVTAFTNDMASGLSVDLICGEVSWVPALAEGGFIQAPADVLSADFYNGYYDYVLNQFNYDGTVYAVPQYYTNSVIFVNKDLVEAAGLSMDNFPTTLDDLKAWIETLDAFYKGNDSVTTVFGLTSAEVPATGANINAMYTAFGGTLIGEDGSLAGIEDAKNETAMTEMLDFYKYLIGNGYTQENLKLKDYRAAFGAGNVCMYVDSSWGYAQIGEVDANAANFTTSAPLPTKMGTYGEGKSLVESHCFLMGAGLSDGQKEAIDLFVQYCTSNEVMGEYINSIGLAFPAHENMADCSLSPILEGAAKGVDNVVSQPQIAAVSSVQIELATMVLNYVLNGVSAKEAEEAYIKEASYYMN